MSWKRLFPERRYYETKNGILYCGDAIEITKLFPEGVFDAVVTDPPYGTTQSKWDEAIPFDGMWRFIKRVRKSGAAIVLFGMEPFSSKLRMSNLKEFKYDWYWNKITATNFLNAKKQPLRNIEIISVFYDKQCTYNPQMEEGYPRKVASAKNRREAAKRFNQREDSVYGTLSNDICGYDSTKRYPKTLLTFSTDKQKEHYHPTQKPLALMEYLIKTYTNEGDLVLDFACGSGTTFLACEKLNRRWIGIEIEKNYCEIVKERIEKSANLEAEDFKQLSIFDFL